MCELNYITTEFSSRFMWQWQWTFKFNNGKNSYFTKFLKNECR